MKACSGWYKRVLVGGKEDVEGHLRETENLFWIPSFIKDVKS